MGGAGCCLRYRYVLLAARRCNDRTWLAASRCTDRTWLSAARIITGAIAIVALPPTHSGCNDAKRGCCLRYVQLAARRCNDRTWLAASRCTDRTWLSAARIITGAIAIVALPPTHSGFNDACRAKRPQHAQAVMGGRTQGAGRLVQGGTHPSWSDPQRTPPQMPFRRIVPSTQRRLPGKTAATCAGGDGRGARKVPGGLSGVELTRTGLIHHRRCSKAPVARRGPLPKPRTPRGEPPSYWRPREAKVLVRPPR